MTTVEFQVPAKVIRSWSEYTYGMDGEEFPHLFCMLEDGRVYQSVKVPCTTGEDPDASLANYTRQWALHTPAVPDR